MFDLVQLRLKAGDGGHGRVSFRREKFIPKGGPDGGHGGHGGSIYLKANPELNTLQHFASTKSFTAEQGQSGGRQNQIGHRGADIVIEVPVGTVVWLTAENAVSHSRRSFRPREGQMQPVSVLQKYEVRTPQESGVPPRESLPLVPVRAEDVPEVGSPVQQAAAEAVVLRSPALQNVDIRFLPKLSLVALTEPGQEYLICQGGEGGRGNESFKSSTHTTPLEAEYGSYGEEKVVLLELRLLADLGLVGFPNVGKSTFLSLMTRANPKIANYPFTTLEPNLGVMRLAVGDVPRDVVIADIPGLIEGASQGKGLGFAFLRHVQACKALVYVLTLEESVVFDPELTVQEKAARLVHDWHVLQQELKEYEGALPDKPWLVVISKADLYDDTLRAAIHDAWHSHKVEPIFLSAVTKEGVNTLQQRILTYLN